MRKNLLLVAVIAALCFSSCFRDGDLDLLRNPIHVSGSFNPQLGVPVAYGSVELNQLLGMLSSDYTGYLDSTTDVLTIKYEYADSGSITRGDGAKKKFYSPRNAVRPWRFKDPSEVDTLSYRDTVFTLYDQDVDVFSSLPINLDSVDINIDSIRLGLYLYFIGKELNINDTIADNVNITIDSLTIDYIDNNGNPKKFDELSTLRLIDNKAILEGNEIDTALNIAQLISDLPKHLTVKVRMRLAILSGLVAGNVMELGFEDLLDSLQMASIDYKAKVGVVFPFKLQIQKFPYETEISLGENGLSSFKFDSIIDALNERVKMGLDLTINEASVNLLFQNNIPLNLKVDVLMVDSNDNEILSQSCDVLGAKTKWSDEYGTNISDGPDPAQLPLMIGITDTATLNKLPSATKIKLKVRIATSQKQHVAVRRTDYMGVRAYVKLRTNVTFDMPLVDTLPIPDVNLK